MPMLIEIFLMLCCMAQPQFCIDPQPIEGKSPVANVTVDHNCIFSLINYAGNCTAFAGLKSEPNYQELKEYCERPLPDTHHTNEFLSYEVVLCMVLYDAAQRVCEVGHQEVTKDNQNFSGNFSCDTMIKRVPESSFESTKGWVTLFKAKFVNISDCEGVCRQDKAINPICEYIWKANALTYQAKVSSAINAVSDISHAENPQENLKGHGKTNKTMTNKNKTSEEKADDPHYRAGQNHSVVNSGSQNTKQVDRKTTPTIKSAVRNYVELGEEKGNSTQSGSANGVKNNVKEKAHTTDSNVQKESKEKAQVTINTVRNDTKKLAHTADSNTHSTNKQAHSTNNNMLTTMQNQEHFINSSNQVAEVTSHTAPVSPINTEHKPEADKDDDNTGKSSSSDSKSNTAPQPENKSPSGGYASDPLVQNQNDNEESVTLTYEKVDKVQGTGVAEEQSEQTKQIETHQEEAETGNTAQFNQLGDADDSHFYAYFMTMVVICIIGYLVFHNKQKILALALEGRSRRGTRRRPNTSAYRKLDSNLEEAVTSACSTSVTHVIY